MNIDTALEKIYSLKQFNVKLGLDNIIELLNHIKNPQNKFKSFHIAGSNGKGSTASFISSILQEHGFKIGLYTSPHLVKFNERIKINGQEISDDYIIKFLDNHKKYIDENNPTFFEITTALAYQYFADKKIDYAVIETGLGGRLDATNTIIPLASIITSISMEHNRILGDSIEKIAYEKAGIIKPGIPVFLGKLPNEALAVIKEISIGKNSIIYNYNSYANEKNGAITIKLNNGYFNIKTTGLSGVHQLYNSVLAVKTLSEILNINNHEIIQSGLDNVIRNTGVQGRYEIYSNNPRIIFDSAHNTDGIKYFLREFSKEKSKCKKSKLIFGVMNDKNIEEIILLLKPFFEKFYLTTINYERSESIENLEKICRKLDINSEKLVNPDYYIKNFIKNEKENCLVILGSIYLLGEIKKNLIK